MISIIILCCLFIALVYFRRAFQYRLQANLLLLGFSKKQSIVLYSLLFLPGIIIHELSHFFAAILLMVPTGDITIFPQFKNESGEEGAGHVLGSVAVGKTDFLRSSLIGAAPLLVGIVLIFSILQIFFKEVLALSSLSATLEWLRYEQASIFNLKNLVWLYLIVAISNTMFLSKRDMRSFPVLAVIVVLILIFIARLGHLEWFRANLTYSISQIALALNTSLMFVLLIDLGCIVFLFVIQKVLEKISGRRIVAASK